MSPPETSKPADFQTPPPPEQHEQLKAIGDKLQKGEMITDYESFNKAFGEQKKDIDVEYTKHLKKLREECNGNKESEKYKEGVKIIEKWHDETLKNLETLKTQYENQAKKLGEEHGKHLDQIHEETLKKAREAANPEIFAKFNFQKDGVWYPADLVIDIDKGYLGLKTGEMVMKHGEHIYKKTFNGKTQPMIIERYEPGNSRQGYDTWIPFHGLDHANQSLTKAIAEKPGGQWTEIPEEQGGEKGTKYLQYNGDFYSKKEDGKIGVYSPETGGWMILDSKYHPEISEEITTNSTIIDFVAKKTPADKETDKWLDGKTEVAQGKEDREYRMIHGTLFSRKKADSQTTTSDSRTPTIESYNTSSTGRWYSWSKEDFEKFKSIPDENVWISGKIVTGGKNDFEYMRSNGKLYARQTVNGQLILQVYNPFPVSKIFSKEITISGTWTEVMKYAEKTKPFFENIKQDGIWIKGDTIGAEAHRDYLRLGNTVYARWKSMDGYYAYEAASITDVEIADPPGDKPPQLNFKRIYSLPFIDNLEGLNNVEFEEQQLQKKQQELEKNKKTANEKIQNGKNLANELDQMLKKSEIPFDEKSIQTYINTDDKLKDITGRQVLEAVKFFQTTTTDTPPLDDPFFENMIKKAESHFEILNTFTKSVSDGIAAMEKQKKENPTKPETENFYSEYLKNNDPTGPKIADFGSNRDAEMRTTLGDLFPGQKALWVTDTGGHKGLAIKIGTEFFYENGRRAIVLNGYKMEIPTTDEDKKKIAEMCNAFKDKTARKRDVSKGFEHKCLRAARLVERYAKTIRGIIEHPENLKPERVAEYEKTLQEADTEMRKEMDRAQRRADEAKSDRAKTAAENAKKRIEEIDKLSKVEFNKWAAKAKESGTPPATPADAAPPAGTPPAAPTTEAPPETASASEDEPATSDPE